AARRAAGPRSPPCRSAAQTLLTASAISLAAGRARFLSSSQTSILLTSAFSFSGTTTRPLAGLSQRRAISPQIESQSCVLGDPRGRGGGASIPAGDDLAGADAATPGQIFSNFGRQTKNATGKRNSTAYGGKRFLRKIPNLPLTSRPNSYLSQNESGTISRS